MGTGEPTREGAVGFSEEFRTARGEVQAECAIHFKANPVAPFGEEEWLANQQGKERSGSSPGLRAEG